jgi:pyruvate dehydrogenase E2 component (dihydrolipoamide acetyltransferase)
MEDGVFGGWLKRDGEPVRAGDPLFTLEGEKATQDVEAIDDGTLSIRANAPAAGDRVLVGAVIGYLLRTGESAPTGREGEPPGEPDANPARTAPDRRHDPSGARAVTRPPGITKSLLVARPSSSPLARRMAKEHGIDWTQLRGSGITGRIRKVDVLEAVRARQSQVQPHLPRSVGDDVPVRLLPVSPTRRIIAERMTESCRTTAPVTLSTTVNATNLVGLRRQFKAAEPDGVVVPSFTDFVVKLTAIALRDHPLLNARWGDGDTPILVSEEAHIGIAVDTEAGLLVPVIHGAAELGIRAVASRSRELIRRARERQLRPADMQGGTFTITNLGAFGIEMFTPIINLPECAILGIGKIERRPVMEGDKVVAQEQMSLSLTFDHRIVDGAPAARFLQQLCRTIENPSPWLMP